jgi:SAM-dependent methyltransferase
MQTVTTPPSPTKPRKYSSQIWIEKPGRETGLFYPSPRSAIDACGYGRDDEEWNLRLRSRFASICSARMDTSLSAVSHLTYAPAHIRMDGLMIDQGRQAHWQGVYTSKGEAEVSWFQESPAISLELIELAGVSPATAIIDVGGGTSRLVDTLVDRGFQAVSVLDVSAAALETAKVRLGARGNRVEWIIADITTWQPTRLYEFWHDRAAFHFLTDERDRAAYVACLSKALTPGGYAMIATFAPDGPERCSGLPVMRYDAQGLAAVLGGAFTLATSRRHEHTTPWGATQRFQFSLFRRTA